MENLGKKLVNAKEKIEFEKPAMSLEVLMHYGNMLVEEQVRHLYSTHTPKPNTDT